MPHFTVQMFEESLDESTCPQLIEALTEAVVSVYGDWTRPLAVVELIGVPQRRWGAAGRSAGLDAPIVTLGLREPALTAPQIDDPPARLITSITDAMVQVLGADVRERVTVILNGVPTGRSGVGGQVV